MTETSPERESAVARLIDDCQPHDDRPLNRLGRIEVWHDCADVIDAGWEHAALPLAVAEAAERTRKADKEISVDGYYKLVDALDAALARWREAKG